MTEIDGLPPLVGEPATENSAGMAKASDFSVPVSSASSAFCTLVAVMPPVGSTRVRRADSFRLPRLVRIVVMGY